MRRHETRIEDGTLYVEDDGDWLEIGAMADITELTGGDQYAIEYDPETAGYFDWLDTDDDGVMTVDVRETLAGMTYPSTFVETLRERSLSPAADGEFPDRTTYFVDVMTDVWDSKGDLDDREDDPFG